MVRDVGDEWTNPLSGLQYIWNGRSWDRIDKINEIKPPQPSSSDASSLFAADDDISFD